MAKVGKILVAVVTVAALVALTYFAPQISASIGLSAAIGSTAGAAVVTAIGSVLISLASAGINSLLFRPKSDMSASKVNVRLEQATRWINGGKVLQGGSIVFAEFDSSGNLWYVILHCDSIANGPTQIYMDNKLVTFSGNSVTTPDFTMDGTPYFSVWTYTYSELNPVPGAASPLETAFPSLWSTLSHMLVGTTYSVVKCNSIKIEDRYKIYKWRGPLGLGEPNVSLFANWSNMYDPRDPTQTLGQRSTYKPSSNAALLWAWWRTHPYGRNKPESSINWDRIAEQANICDQSVVGIESTQPRYECAIAAQDNVDRAAIEQQIMMSCDGQLVFDDDGKTWMRVGYYYTPTLSFSRNRDIISMESVEAQEGESETQGVIVRYLDRDANYTLQASAPWYNPNYYAEGQGNTFLTVDIPTCSNHNQAMRLAKALGMRSQPLQKLGPVLGLRGLRAMQERVVAINYDNTFAGDYELITPVEVDESGAFCSLGLVPIDPNRFDLLPGEEKVKPNSGTTETAVVLPTAAGVTIVYNNGRIEARFNTPTRPDITYEFEYIAEAQLASGQWAQMTTEMNTRFAYSGVVDTSIKQLVRYRTVTTGGAQTAWSANIAVEPMEIIFDGGDATTEV